jgi:hypothetical protein
MWGQATMSDNMTRTSLPPFPPDYRASGLRLHVTMKTNQCIFNHYILREQADG